MKDTFKLKKKRFSLRELINKAIVRKYVFNHSVYNRTLVQDYKGLLEVHLIDKDGYAFQFIMTKDDGKQLAKQIKSITTKKGTSK